jgi:hypothetical protein
MPRRRSRRAKKRRRQRASPSGSLTRNADAETQLLALARALAALPEQADVAAALRVLAAAHAPEAPLPRAMAQAWLRGGEDKTAALALAWAREQVRLALEERLLRAPARGAVAADPATRAWLLLAAAESIAREPPGAAADRLRALLELTGHAVNPA